MEKDLYGILGVKKDATFDEIKKAYRKKVKKCHPDYGGDVEEFRRVQEAYSVLSHEERRAAYDLTGKIISINDLDTQAVEYLAIKFKQVFDSLDNKDLLIKSIVLEVKSQLLAELEKKKKAIKFESERMKLFNILKKRIKTKRKTHRNVAREVLEGEIGYCKNAIVICKQDIKRTRKALEYLGYLKTDFTMSMDNIVRGHYELVEIEEEEVLC